MKKPETVVEKQIDISALGPDYSIFILQCWMAHPANDDENMRNQLHAMQWLEITEFQGADYPHSLQRNLIDALKNGGEAHFKNSAWAGMMAGYALLVMLQMVEQNHQESIRDNAFIVVSDALKKIATKSKEKTPGHSDMSVKAAWNKYKDVAHLWAAYLYWLHNGKPGLDISALSGPALAAVADALKTAGAYALPNGAGPIMPLSALSLHGFNKISLSEIKYDIADIESHVHAFKEPTRGRLRSR